MIQTFSYFRTKCAIFKWPQWTKIFCGTSIQYSGKFNSSDSNNLAQLTEIVTSSQERNLTSDDSSPITTDMVIINND